MHIDRNGTRWVDAYFVDVDTTVLFTASRSKYNITPVVPIQHRTPQLTFSRLLNISRLIISDELLTNT